MATYVGHSYGDTSLIEDVTDIIYQISPTDTPIYQMSGDTDASHPYHQWQRRELTLRQANAQVEGFAYTFTNPATTPVRVGNACQILRREVRITETNQAISHYAIDDEFADQLQVAMTGLKTDMEQALVCGTVGTGATGTARTMDGVCGAVQAAGTTFTHGMGTQVISETTFTNFISIGWGVGAEYRDCLVGARAKRFISTFTASSTRYIEADEQRVVRTLSVYETDFWPVTMHLSRDVPNFGYGTVTLQTGFGLLFTDRTMLKKAWLRRPVAERVAKTHDALDGLVKAELTLEYGHPCGHFYASGYTV